MQIRTRATSELKGLKQRAAGLLETYHVPPQRYGTAFHLAPPFTDLRQISFSVARDLKSFEHIELSEKEWGHIASTIDGDDPYLLSQITQLEHVGNRILRVEEGQSLSLQVDVSEVMWIFLQPGARLIIEQTILNQEIALPRIFVWQGEGSEFTYWGLRARNNFLSERIQVKLQGSQASTQIRHLTFGQEKQQSDIEVSAYHEAPATKSDLIVRTAAADRHVAIYRGLIDIEEGARGSKGYQSGRALLLSRRAVVDNLPELAIKTNDVQCSHGVTTTHIDDEALFYMRSRGLLREEARKLAITGFYHDKLEIPDSLAQTLESVTA